MRCRGVEGRIPCGGRGCGDILGYGRDCQPWGNVGAAAMKAFRGWRKAGLLDTVQNRKRSKSA